MARRLAAILAADVVGYSRLMAADEKATHARLKALRTDFVGPTVHEHHGRVVKLMGDGALVEFASVVDAVECAAAIQKGVAEHQAELPEDERIAFRIGINIGDIIIEAEDIYGDGVNVAARVEALAEPGGICVSRPVYNHVRNKVSFGFEPAGEHKVKNIPEPVVVYRVLIQPGPIAKVLRLSMGYWILFISGSGFPSGEVVDLQIRYRPADTSAFEQPTAVEATADSIGRLDLRGGVICPAPGTVLSQPAWSVQATGRTVRTTTNVASANC